MREALNGLLPLIGVLVGAALQYAFGRSLEVRRQVEGNKAQAYSDYLRAFADIAKSRPTPEILGRLVDAKTRVCVYGSPSVIRLLGEFERAGAKATPANQPLVTDLVLAMRRDVRALSGIPERADLSAILFGPTS